MKEAAPTLPAGMETPHPIESAAAWPLTALAELFTGGFAGYVIPVQMTPAALAERIAAEDVDLAASRVLLRDGRPAGLALVARRGWQSRVAAMGVRPEARGHGSGRALLERLLEDARARGDRRMRLEVFESNAPARALYERGGFRTTARLVGYEHPALAPAEVPLEPVDPAAFARHLAASAPGPLPWQLEPASLAAPPAAARCFTVDGTAFVYFSGVSERAVSIRGVLTLPEHRRKGKATLLLRALAARFRGVPLSVPPLLPSGLGEPFFSALGFRQGALTQLEMALDLPPAA